MSGGPASRDDVGTGSRWGRFLGAGILPRALVTILGAPLLVWAGVRGGVFFLATVHLIIALGLREFQQLATARGYRVPAPTLLLSGLGVALVMGLRPEWTGATVTAAVLLVAVSELLRRDADGGRALANVGAGLLGVFYVAWLGGHLVLLRGWEPATVAAVDIGVRALGLAVLCTWSCDTAAYLVGVSVGRSPLMKRVSPKKSREGAFGGLIAAAGAGAWCAVGFAAPVVSVVEGLLLGALVGVAAQAGDLVESLLKRDAGVKDTADLLPGHGGVLDRFDSLLFTVPLVYHVLALGFVGPA